MSENEKKKSVGEQVIERHGKEAAPETREVTNESWWKTFQPRLKKELEEYKGTAKKVYIMLSIKNEGILGQAVKHATWLLFEDEEPPPKQSAVLWSYRLSDQELRLEWALPDECSIEEICAMPETYDKKLVADCKNYMKAQRIAVSVPKERPKAKAARPKILLPD